MNNYRFNLIQLILKEIEIKEYLCITIDLIQIFKDIISELILS
jgi:hypothetical protein